ncbi:hypothetical protein B9T31_11550 [Acinetobacter sp. ANC 4558]|uniref:hypothetical protein n=1 Tax=Acinetobacter sp. ANC 4558 TaxID=1977876 RepID=UPI000A337B39|nr:hypothetical protein [Acinetobacter sp. ANC 4558]OTG85427.1 hypothetical protein B9T31_11550 [Acinetobacter sp. ANC 4558]
MISNIQQKYDQLTQAQKDIFAGYGLRQVKHFVEVNLPTITAILPDGAHVQGINAEGKLQALNSKSRKTYIWISDKQWQEKPASIHHIDSKEDFLKVWEVFNLQNHDLIDLSHVHRDFLESQTA